jgi:hypothetical protein
MSARSIRVGVFSEVAAVAAWTSLQSLQQALRLP